MKFGNSSRLQSASRPNELDMWPKTEYNGEVFPQGTIDYCQDLWNIVRSGPDYRDTPIVMPSMADSDNVSKLTAITPAPVGYADYGNTHAYQWGGLADNRATWNLSLCSPATANHTVMATEMGYCNSTPYGSDWQPGVSQRASAIYLPIAFCEFFNRGAKRTYVYELIDDKPDPQFKDGEVHYGILNNDGSPKPAYTALKNMIAIVKDSDKKFTPAPLDFSLEGAPDTLHSTLVQKANGAYYLILWNDVSVFDVATKSSPGEDINPQPVPVTVTFGSRHKFTVYAPNDASGVRPTSAYTLQRTPSAIKLNVPGQMVILEIQK